jgi:predicted molibdopterin-dependent oxidoreductase YjgC
MIDAVSRRARMPVVRIEVDGMPLEAREGDSVASALLAAGRRALRKGPDDAPRGVFCGIGACFDCLVTIDGRPGQRACLAPVRDGMSVRCLD